MVPSPRSFHSLSRSEVCAVDSVPLPGCDAYESIDPEYREGFVEAPGELRPKAGDAVEDIEFSLELDCRDSRSLLSLSFR